MKLSVLLITKMSEWRGPWPDPRDNAGRYEVTGGVHDRWEAKWFKVYVPEDADLSEMLQLIGEQLLELSKKLGFRKLGAPELCAPARQSDHFLRFPEGFEEKEVKKIYRLLLPERALMLRHPTEKRYRQKILREAGITTDGVLAGLGLDVYFVFERDCGF